MTNRDVDTVGPDHRLEALSNMPDCQLAEGTPDIRGWEVTSPTSVHLGTVQDLLVDLASLRVRYLDIVLDASTSPTRRVLLPIGKAWINDALDEVVAPTSPSLDTLPEYDPARFDRQFEQDLLAAFGDVITADFYGGSAFDIAGAKAARGEHVTCTRRATDTEDGPCPIADGAINGTEAANGVELSVVADAAN
jgi:photosynthetic reaction center H subunit